MSESIKRNYLTPDKTVWETPDGVLHIDAVRMCEVLGVPPTQANQDIVESECIKTFSLANPGAPVQTVYDLL